MSREFDWPLLLLLLISTSFGFAQQPEPNATDAKQPTTNQTPTETKPATQENEHPADHLPKHIKRLTWFGQQAEWSADGGKVIFLEKTFGDVFEFEIKTRTFKPLTAHFPHHGFTRARYLSNGDILLAGPKKTFDRTKPESRQAAMNACYLSVLKAGSDKPPTPLNIACGGDPAVSRKAMRIAWAVQWRQAPETLKEGESQIFVAELKTTDQGYELVDKKIVIDSRNLPFTMHSLEVQAFRPGDENELIFTAFQFQGTEVFGVDLESGKEKNYSANVETYNAARCAFPDGKSVAIESAVHEGNPWPLVDIYRLWLDGAGETERLTYFREYKGYQATNPAISPDGKSMCFQLSKEGDEREAGRGLFLYDLENAPMKEK